MWRDVAAVAPPDSLERTLDHYVHRGRLPFHEDETVTRDSWAAAMLGLGVIPRNIDPQVRNVPLGDAVAAMERLALEIDDAVASVPAYGNYLKRITG